MATGAAPASFMSLKGRGKGLGFAKTSDFVKVSDMKRVKFHRTKIFVIKNSNPGSDIAELRPASEGSPLLVPVQKYCEATHKTIRRKTRTVMVADVALGSDHPIRIQTMTTSDTKDVAATVEQVMQIADRGADLVRITVQGKREADACFEIKNTLVKKKPIVSIDFMISLPTHGAVVGAWPMPLDWERRWQEWPICVTYGAIIGYLVGMLASFGFVVFRASHQHAKGSSYKSRLRRSAQKPKRFKK